METNIIKVPLAQLRPNPWQPPSRLIVSEAECRKWGEDILQNGLRQIPVGRGKDGVYEIADGWQRKCWFEWLVKNGHPVYDSLPIDLQELTDEQMAEYPEATDDSKKKLTVFDRAWSWKKRLADFPKTTQKQFAQRHGISQGELSNTIRLLELPESVQRLIISHEISESHGRALLALKDPALMVEFAIDTIKCSWSVADLDETIKFRLNKQKPKLVEETPPEEKTNADSEPKTVLQSSDKLGMGEQAATSGIETDKADADMVENHETQAAGKLAQEIVKNTFGKKPAPPKEPPKPPAKTPPTPVKPVAPASVKPAWKRKLVLEEIGENIRVSYGKVGGIPKFAKINGTLEDALTTMGLRNFMTITEAQWAKEGK